jgi:hypothetical protein
VTENLDSSVVMIAHITISLFFYKKILTKQYIENSITPEDIFFGKILKIACVVISTHMVACSQTVSVFVQLMWLLCRGPHLYYSVNRLC